ncbi:MAG TPA: NTP transferase domain-containing protein [Candidatus Omnitrophota bacterium]|jgi:bifunctional UDP-N-acetylglucosamine pyrophosphorylase/glucosamine-1-phosphate N-acetyltransferase|nr:NTP transferase domain-containing protein [Candidatus Omnitrophota bacterium]
MDAVVLAAGKGTRMRTELPKVLHTAFGKPVLGYVLDTLAAAGIRKPLVVVGYKAGLVKSFLKNYDARPVLQTEQKGTGHAVMMTRSLLKGSKGPVLIWPGDMPLVETGTIERFVAANARSRAHASVLSSVVECPKGYGRIVREDGKFVAIREELDATDRERSLREVNTGIYLFDRELLFRALARIGSNNRKNEYYLTDTIEVLREEGCKVEAFPFAAAAEGTGINSQKDLATVTERINQREIERHMERGVTFVSPARTFVAPGVVIGAGTVVNPWCWVETGVTIGKNCKIGPFAKFRPGTKVGDGSEIGSFVEVNRSTVGKGVCAKHLSYLGDAVIGDGVNIGAGAITANYDGKNKHVTKIGKNALIGSNTVLVAPLVVPERVKTGAGAVVTRGTRMKKGGVVVGIPARQISKKKR